MAGPPPQKKKKRRHGKKPTATDSAVSTGAADVPPKPAHRDRSRFDDIVSDFMPPSIAACQTALSRVGADLKLTGREVPTFPGVHKAFIGFLFPEASTLAMVKNQSTQTTFLVNFVRLLPILEYNVERIEDAREDMAHLRSSVWRNLLAGFEGEYKEGTLAAEKRDLCIKNFTMLLEESGLPVRLRTIVLHCV